MIFPQFIDHLVFRVSELDRTEHFYSLVLGQNPERAENSVMYLAGDTRLFFTVSRPPQGTAYNKENVGINHLAFGVRRRQDLAAVQQRLEDAKITHSGIKIDHYGQKEFIWLDDPDRMRVEFYLRAVS